MAENRNLHKQQNFYRIIIYHKQSKRVAAMRGYHETAIASIRVYWTQFAAGCIPASLRCHNEYRREINLATPTVMPFQPPFSTRIKALYFFLVESLLRLVFWLVRFYRPLIVDSVSFFVSSRKLGYYNGNITKPHYAY